MRSAILFFTFLFVYSCQSLNNSDDETQEARQEYPLNDRTNQWVEHDEITLEITPEGLGILDSSIYLNISHSLANGVLQEYISSGKKDSIELLFEEFAQYEWGVVEQLTEIEQKPFEVTRFGLPFGSEIDTIIVQDDYSLVLIKMELSNGESWNGGTCPGIGYIIKMDGIDGGYSYGGCTGEYKYSFKYGKSPTSIVVRENDSGEYLEVRTYAGGVGNGREGIVLYSMEPFGEILFNNIYHTFYTDIRWLPEDTSSCMWALDLLNVDKHALKGGELDIESTVTLDYIPNSDWSKLNVRHEVNIRIFTGIRIDDKDSTYSDSLPEFTFNHWYSYKPE